jgi:hypothetical protein
LQAQRFTASVCSQLAVHEKKRLMAHAANATEEFFVRKRPLYEVSFPLNLVAIGKYWM